MIVEHWEESLQPYYYIVEQEHNDFTINFENEVDPMEPKSPKITSTNQINYHHYEDGTTRVSYHMSLKDMKTLSEGDAWIKEKIAELTKDTGKEYISSNISCYSGYGLDRFSLNLTVTFIEKESVND